MMNLQNEIKNWRDEDNNFIIGRLENIKENTILDYIIKENSCKVRIVSIEEGEVVQNLKISRIDFINSIEENINDYKLA